MMFSAQATSAPSEVAFSHAGFLKNDHRSRLRPSVLNMMSVLKINVCRFDEDADKVLTDIVKYAEVDGDGKFKLTPELQAIIEKLQHHDEEDDEIELIL